MFNFFFYTFSLLSNSVKNKQRLTLKKLKNDNPISSSADHATTSLLLMSDQPGPSAQRSSVPPQAGMIHDAASSVCMMYRGSSGIVDDHMDPGSCTMMLLREAQPPGLTAEQAGMVYHQQQLGSGLSVLSGELSGGEGGGGSMGDIMMMDSSIRMIKMTEGAGQQCTSNVSAAAADQMVDDMMTEIEGL